MSNFHKITVEFQLPHFFTSEFTSMHECVRRLFDEDATRHLKREFIEYVNTNLHKYAKAAIKTIPYLIDRIGELERENAKKDKLLTELNKDPLDDLLDSGSPDEKRLIRNCLKTPPPSTWRGF